MAAATKSCLLSFTLLTHCAGVPRSGGPTPETSPKPPTPTVTTSATLPIAEMRFVASRPQHPANSKIVLIVHADGLVERVGAPSAHILDARIIDNRIVCPDRSEILSVDGQDRVVVDGRIVGGITTAGEFAIDPSYGGWSLTVTDEGSVSMTTVAEGRTSTDALRWEGFRPEARRTAAVLSALLMPAFGGWWCGSPRPGSWPESPNIDETRVVHPERKPTSSTAIVVEQGAVERPAIGACAGDEPDDVAGVLANAGEASGKSWSELSPGVGRDLAAGKPLVVYVYVPLCSNQQIWCGSNVGGNPVGLNSNIYWGAIFGARRFFDDYRTPYERVETIQGQTPDLERIVYRQRVSGAPWGRPAGEKIEQIVVLQAVDGSRINGAVERFWNAATRGGCVSFKDGDRERTERIHVVGYAGHNRLMDNVRLPPKPSADEASPIPSFVLACFSERYFGPSLRSAGARPLVTTRSYMAPEGYLVRAIAEGLAANESPEALRQRAALVQRSWQKTLSPFQSLWIFWPFEL